MKIFALLFASVACLALLKPTVQLDDPVPHYIADDSMVIAKIKDSNSYTAYSATAGQWTTHTFGAGLTATPILGQNVAVFKVTGEGAQELVAIDAKGNWCRHRHPDGPYEKCDIIVGNNIAVAIVDKSIYCFSSTHGKWERTNARGEVNLSNDRAMVVEEDHITIFSNQSGKWSSSPDLSKPLSG